MEKRFYFGNQKRIDELTNFLVDELLPTFNLSLFPIGGVRDKMKNVDFSEYSIKTQNSVIGSYEFGLKNEVYECKFAISHESEKTLFQILSEKFPEVRSDVT